jgi:hypothetical protein
MHVYYPDPCCMTKAVLHVHVHAACPWPHCISMSMLHVHVNAACPCQCPYTYNNNAGISGIRSVRFRTEKKIMIPKQVWYRTKLTQSGIMLVRYQTKIRDARMPMPVSVSSMLMPIYAFWQVTDFSINWQTFSVKSWTFLQKFDFSVVYVGYSAQRYTFSRCGQSNWAQWKSVWAIVVFNNKILFYLCTQYVHISSGGQVTFKK